jgi:hypothetical protein
LGAGTGYLKVKKVRMCRELFLGGIPYFGDGKREGSRVERRDAEVGAEECGLRKVDRWNENFPMDLVCLN